MRLLHPQSYKSKIFLTVAPEPSCPRAAKPVNVQGDVQECNNASANDDRGRGGRGRASGGRGRARGGRGRASGGRQRARGGRGRAHEQQSGKFYISIKLWWLNIRGN